MIVSLLVLTGCKVDDLAVKVDENAANAENAVNNAASKADADVKAAAKKAADDLAAAQAKLEKLIKDGDAADTASLAAAVKDFNAAIAAIDEALTGADAALKAELVADFDEKIETATKMLQEATNTAIGKATEELEAAIAKGDAATAAQLSDAIASVAGKLANLDAVVQETAIALDDIVKAELGAVIKELADKVSADTKELNTLLALKADKTVVDAAAAKLDVVAGDLDALKDVVAALSGDDGALADLKIYVDEKIAAAKAAADVAYIVVENWDAATELIIDAIVEISTHFNTKVDADFYYDDDYAIIVALYEEYRIRLTRAVDADAVDAVLNSDNGYYAAVETVDTKADVIYAVLTAEGKTVDEVLLNDAWKKAIDDAQALLAAETDADVVAFLAEVQKLADAMEAKYNALNGAKVEADLINAEVKALIDMFINDGWTVAAKDKSEAALKAIADWDAKYGAANADLIDRKNVEKLNVASAEALAAYTKTAQALADKLAAYNADTYVFVYTADSYTAITALETEYTKWAADVVARGFALTGEIEAPVAAAHTAFAADALARATALNTANTEATAIETLIANLTEELNNFTVVRSAYQDALNEIKAKAAAWDTAYFAAPFDAIDAAEKANYELLDHAAVTAVEALYNEKMGEVMRLAEELKAALKKIETINIFSGADIEAAQAAYTAFTNWLADLKYEIEGLADTATITNTLASKTVEFNNLAAEAIAAYDALAVKSAKDVKLTSADDIAALKAWFTKYFGIDVADDAAALPEGITEVVLDATHKVTADTVKAAVEAVNAFELLTAAKAEELAALKAELEALVAKKPATDLRAAVDAALANYAEWLDGSNVPAGYEKTQFIPVDATVLDTLKADLDALEAAVKVLEDAYKALQDRIAALELDYTKIADTAAAQATLDALNADIEAFIVDNNNVDCFTEAEKKTLADAQTAIDQAVALAELLEDYNNLIASLAGIADTRVVENMTARADAALKAAEEAVKANNEAAIDLAYANFELFAATVAEYKASLTACAGDATKEAKVYEAYVILDDRKDMVKADQLADELNIVKETFAAVLK
jgi:hypothetical protein